MESKFSKVIATVVLAWAAVASPFSSTADAALLEGKLLRANLLHRTTPTSITNGPEREAVVGPGVEFPEFGQQINPEALPALVDIDISDTQIRLTLLIDQPPADQEIIRLFDVNDSNDFRDRNLKLNPATTWAGMNEFLVSGGNNVVHFVLTELSGLAGQQILVDVVPEPATSLLTLAGAVAGAAAHRRRRGNC
jgi:hypothetical protein